MDTTANVVTVSLSQSGLLERERTKAGLRYNRWRTVPAACSSSASVRRHMGIGAT